LGRLYGGGLGLPRRGVYANFVSSLDGVVALNSPGVSSGPTLSGHSPPDRFVMGLLRAAAGAVLIGAGTLREDAGHLWTPAYIYPPMAGQYARLRGRLGLAGDPLLAVVTGSGDLDPAERALQAGALVVTAEGVEARLRRHLPGSARVVAAGPAPLDMRRVLAAVRAEAGPRVLTEGGPTLAGSLLRDGVLDELFLTVSPAVAGRIASRARPGLVQGLELLPGEWRAWRLLSVRRQGSHLFLRYRRSAMDRLGVDLETLPPGQPAGP
jgi:riboflavin biosynthesis pyrimidine reductase